MRQGLVDAGADAGQACFNAPPAFDLSVGRLIDIVIATLGIIFMLPLMVLIALAVLVTDPGPVLFAHWRVGRGGRSFPCFKFRTMVMDSERLLEQILATDPIAHAEWKLNRKLRHDPRITPLGSFLRKSSLDEIPQLLNVLRGEMSIVGPRPIIADEIQLYGVYFAHYCQVNPGITGFWQTSGRNDVAYRSRVAMDVVYARNKSLLWDLKIMLVTVPAVLWARGSY